MTGLDVVIQQVVNGLALGMMYALLALGFTMVYGIIELINFSHFSVFMTGTFVGLFVLNLMGVTAVSRSLSGVALVGTLLLLFLATMAACSGAPGNPEREARGNEVCHGRIEPRGRTRNAGECSDPAQRHWPHGGQPAGERAERR